MVWYGINDLDKRLITRVLKLADDKNIWRIVSVKEDRLDRINIDIL